MIERDTIVVIGSGLMGSGIAARSALAGNPTILVDNNELALKAGYQKAFECIDELKDAELYSNENAKTAKNLLKTSVSLIDACNNAKGVIEAVTEKLKVKQDLFEKLDLLLPAEVPLMSNTSGLRITDIAAKTKHPERTMTTHFWFPAHLVPLVEVVMSDFTDLNMATKVKDMLNSWGKEAVLVKKDLPGQLANRLLQAIIREAINVVEIGLASAEDVDTAVKMGMGIRMPIWGPLEHVEAVGLDLALSVQKSVLPEISNASKVSPYLENMVDNGDLGYKTGKGFYDWSVKDMDKLASDRNAFILNALQFMKKN